MLRPLITTALLVLSVVSLRAQIEYATWVFGVNAAVRFTIPGGGIDSIPTVIDGPQIDVREGSMVYSYPCDKALSVYAMGETAYDAQGKVVVNGTVLSGGASSSQGGIFVRDLQKPYSLYLYITPDMTDISATQSPYYTRNKMERRGDGLWEIVEREVVLETRPGSERISATHDAAGTGYWVLTQYTDTASATIEFVAYHHTPTGIDATPVRSRISGVPIPHQAGMLKFSADGTKLAMTNVSDLVVAVYDFNTSTGVVSGRRSITLDRPRRIANMSVCYGLSFSLSGSITYVSMRATATDGTPTRSYVFRFATPPSPGNVTITPEIVCYTPLHNTYPSALQLAPNGRIYFTNNRTLGEITDPETPIGSSVPVVLDKVSFKTGNRSLLGLPTCMESTYLRPTPTLVCDVPQGTVTAPSGCVGTCITITHAVLNAPDTWLWQFPGGLPSTWSGPTPPPVCYNTAGRYPVILTATNEAGTSEIRDTADIMINPGVDAGTDIMACMGGPVTLRAQAGGSVEWTDLSTNSVLQGEQPIVRCDVPTMFRAVTWQPCYAADTVLVKISPDVEIVRTDTSVCRGGSVDLVLYPGTRIEWEQGADPIARIDDSTYRFSPRETFVYEGLVRWADTCTQRLLLTVLVIDKRQIEVRVAPAAGGVGDTISVDVRVRTTSIGGSVRVQMEPLDGIEWQDPWDSSYVVMLDSSEMNFTSRVVAYVNGSRTRLITTIAEVSDTCSTVTYEPGLLTVEQCALEFRQVRFTKPLTITSTDGVVVVDGQDQIDVVFYDVLGRCLERHTGMHHLDLSISEHQHFPIFVVATQGAQHIIHCIR